MAKGEDNGNVLERVDPREVKRIHLIGVGGTGMGTFAGMLKTAGYTVTGSDQNVYPPMSEMLEEWGIEVLTPYQPENLDAARPDLVVTGNVVRRVNPEATAVRERALPQMSFPAALGSFFLEGRHPVVVTGTHGKTTASAMLAHVLTHAGRDPTFLVGGVTANYRSNYRLGRGPHVVLEGDEYDTAYFDKGPKFLHYRPRTALLTSLELDHVDIFRDLTHYTEAFERFANLLPADGFLAVSAAYPTAVALASKAAAQIGYEVMTYAVREGLGADVEPRGLRFSEEGTRFEVVVRDESLGELFLPMGGAHNVENALGVFAAARDLGLTFEQIREALGTFQGVRRRQERRGEPGGVMVIDDFAHHPTAVRETVSAVRGRYASRRLLAVFEPRSNTSRSNLHQAEYPRAFPGADAVFLRVPEKHDQVREGEGLDVDALVSALEANGTKARCESDVDALVTRVAEEARTGDVVLVMSNGSFGGFIGKLLETLGQAEGADAGTSPGTVDHATTDQVPATTVGVKEPR